MRWYPAQRSTQPELMDDLQSDPPELERTLSQMVLVNRLLSRRGTVLSRFLLDHVAEGPQREYRVLDLGAGGGDIAIWLARRARRRGLRLRITAADHDPRVVSFAERKCAGEPAVTVVQASAGAPLGEYDYVICNHLLHHLGDDEIPAVLHRIHDTGAIRFIANDLLRSYASLVGFRVLAALFLHRSFARVDGEISILKGFRPDELLAFFRASPWGEGARVLSLMPGRLCVVADRKPGSAPLR